MRARWWIALLAVACVRGEQVVERDIAAAQTHELAVQAQAGQFLHAMVEQKGADVSLTWVDPEGKALLTMDATPTIGFEQASTIAAASGKYVLRVAAKTTGRYKAVIDDPRAPRPEDFTRFRAETLLMTGINQDTIGSKETRAAALDTLSRSIALWRELRDSYEEGVALDKLAGVRAKLGDSRAALSDLQQALNAHRAAGDRAGEAASINAMGNARDDLGEPQQALVLYQQALEIRRAIGDRYGEGATLSNLGNVSSELGEKQKALDYYRDSLALRRAVNDHAGEAAVLTNMGIVYRHLRQLREALLVYQQALPLWGEAGNHTMTVRLLSNIGAVFEDLDQAAKAIEVYQLALPIERDAGDRSGEAGTLVNMGNAYASLGQNEKALECHQQALTLMRTIGNRAGEAVALNNVGATFVALRRTPQALESFVASLPLEREAGDRSGEALTLRNLMRLFETTQPDLAVMLGKRAVNIVQTLRRDNRDLAPPLRRSFDESLESYYRALADLLIARNRFAEAEEVLNLLKDKEAADFLRSDTVAAELRSATLLAFEKTALARYEQIVGRIAALGEQRAALLAKNEPAPAALDADLEAANTVLRKFIDEQAKAFAPDSAGARRVEDLKEAEGLQDAIAKLGPGVVAIYTLVGPEKYVAMLVTAGARKAYVSPIRERDLNAKILEFRQKLQDPSSDPVALARELYAIVFPPGLRADLDAISARTIMWSMDNTLRYLPIAALHDGHDYLVKTFRNSILTPASLANLTEEPARQWEGAGFGVSESPAPLPSVPGELRGIFRETPESSAPVPGSVRLNGAFTRAAFEQELRRRRQRVVHIATHFASRPGTAADSKLLLGDGVMSLAEIESKTRLFNGVDLLTLSACQTAFANRNEDGREVDSFGTVAQRLGAKAVIASLWSVSDASTARLMQTMYKLRQESGMPKGEALRQAQVALLESKIRGEGGADRLLTLDRPRVEGGNWSHPFYWAPFVLIGNWK
jgi:CHAT domain-containing protein